MVNQRPVRCLNRPRAIHSEFAEGCVVNSRMEAYSVRPACESELLGPLEIAQPSLRKGPQSCWTLELAAQLCVTFWKTVSQRVSFLDRTDTEDTVVIFCQIFRESPVQRASTSLAAATATGSSNLVMYNAAILPTSDSISVQ